MSGKSLILFDGVCNLCNGFVNFIIPRDRDNKFQFGSLQTERVKAILSQYQHAPNYLSTVILLEDEKIYTQSTAVLRILRRMGGAWALLYGFIILPKPIRDFFYNLVAKHRYKLFGRKDSCMLPTPGLKARFVE